MNIKELRLAAKMRQGEFARFIGVPLRTLQDWESGKHEPVPYLVELIKYKLKNENLI